MHEKIDIVKFDRLLYKKLSMVDREIVDEYKNKMTIDEINSFMRRFIDYYLVENSEESLEVNEDSDSTVVFESSNISKIDTVNNFIDNFILTTNSIDDINLFFINEKNFIISAKNEIFYKNNEYVIEHFFKYLKLDKANFEFINQLNEERIKELISNGIRAFFDKSNIYRGTISLHIMEIIIANIPTEEKSAVSKNFIIPYKNIINVIDNYFNKKIYFKNKSAQCLRDALYKYFVDEYSQNISNILKSYPHIFDELDIKYIMDFSNYLSDVNLQNKLYDNNIGWIPQKNIHDYIRHNYIELARKKTDIGLIREIKNAELPISFYTYRIDDFFGKKKNYKKRIGIVIDKTVLSSTNKALAGYSKNFKMDKKFIGIKLVTKTNIINLSQFVKSGMYWSPENALSHGFDDRVGIIWFNGKAISKNKWKFPNGLVIDGDITVIVNCICTSDLFAKMFKRFNFDDKMRQIVLALNEQISLNNKKE